VARGAAPDRSQDAGAALQDAARARLPRRGAETPECATANGLSRLRAHARLEFAAGGAAPGQRAGEAREPDARREVLLRHALRLAARVRAGARGVGPERGEERAGLSRRRLRLRHARPT